ncbi:MAG: sulfatase-like hydrolase/transferase, partial [Solirubrobacteraceae bacterium]
YGPDVHTEFLIDFMTTHREEPFLAFWPATLPHFSKPAEETSEQDALASYAEMVEELDFQVRRLVDSLDHLGLAEDTLVLFSADNGTPGGVVSKLGDREIAGGKSLLTDAGTHVPLLARWPGVVPAGSVCPALIDLSDFLPTLAELAHAPLPEGVVLDGRSFAPLLRGEPGPERTWVHGAWAGRAYLRGMRWKLYASGELYDLDADPDENAPLLATDDSPEAAAARAQLAAALTELMSNPPA